MDITAPVSFQALAEAIRLYGLAKARRGWVSPTLFVRSAAALKDPLFPEAATVIAAH